VTDSHAAPPIDLEDTPAGRILRAARDIMLAENYSGLTMDGLAYALGMSKKTLYAHFPSKDAMVLAIIEATGRTIRRQAAEVMARPEGVFSERLRAVFSIVGIHIGTLTPRFLADLQRFAPHLLREIDALKERNIPVVFGAMLQNGRERGMVRADVDIPFLIEYWLQVIKGVHQPELLGRTGMTAQAAFDAALDLFFNGVLTDAGRAQRPGTASGPEK
jgi:AcrR family transcriptional regulator